MRRLVVLVVALFVLSLGLAVAPPAAAQTDPATAEADFVARINALRASKGLRQLAVHAELVGLGRSWAGQMAKADQISHNPDLANAVKADWQKLGENVGVGMTVEKLHQAFMDSPTHYKNLVDPDWTHLGVGVVLGRDGAIFTAHQFMELRASAPPPPTTAAPAPRPTTTRPPATTPPPAHEPPAETTTTAPPEAPTDAPGGSVPAAATPSPRFVLVLEQLVALDALGV